MVALYILFYNFIRTHGSLRMTPAMAAGLALTFMSFEDVLTRVDADQIPKDSRPLQETRHASFKVMQSPENAEGGAFVKRVRLHGFMALSHNELCLHGHLALGLWIT